MTNEQMLKNLTVPDSPIDVVLDTDAYNEIDDQFAIAYMLLSKEKLNTKAIYAAPFLNERSVSPCDGMEKSYDEILKLLNLMDIHDMPVFKGSTDFLTDENTPIQSAAAIDLIERARKYTPENPLYVVAIGAITNVASALLMDPEIAENIVIVWLGGHSRDFHDTREFNMEHDFAAAKIVMGSKAPFVQLPCFGVVSEFRISGAELEYWLMGKNKLATYLAENTITDVNRYAKGKPWTRVVWDVTAVAWLLNDKNRFMLTRTVKTKLPEYNGFYSDIELDKPMAYTYWINRDGLMYDLIKKITYSENEA